MRAWPRSVYAALVVLLIVFAVAARWLYIETRAAYRAVGFNDGQIQQREQTMTTLRQLTQVADCKQLRGNKPPVELLAVKAESLYVVAAEDGSVRFCR
jgi:hypothetical protein